MKTMSLTAKIILAFTLPLAVVYYFLVIPQISATSQALADIEVLRGGSSLATTAKQKETFKANITALRAEAKQLLPATDQQYDLSVQVENLAKANSLTITSRQIFRLQLQLDRSVMRHPRVLWVILLVLVP
jgi:hypothetical protein